MEEQRARQEEEARKAVAASVAETETTTRAEGLHLCIVLKRFLLTFWW